MRKRKTNSSPESDFCKVFLKYLKTQPKFDINFIEAKATYNPAAGRYISGQVAPGYPDMSGNDDEGRAMYLEAKAPGKRKQLRPEQYIFLEKKIKMGCFAICFDSCEYFITTYNKWLTLKDDEAKNYLLGELHKPKILRDQDDGPLFPED